VNVARRTGNPACEQECAYGSVERNDWVVAPGARPLFVGSSSRDLRLRGEVRGDD